MSLNSSAFLMHFSTKSPPSGFVWGCQLHPSVVRVFSVVMKKAHISTSELSMEQYPLIQSSLIKYQTRQPCTFQTYDTCMHCVDLAIVLAVLFFFCFCFFMFTCPGTTDGNQLLAKLWWNFCYLCTVPVKMNKNYKNLPNHNQSSPDLGSTSNWSIIDASHSSLPDFFIKTHPSSPLRNSRKRQKEKILSRTKG